MDQDTLINHLKNLSKPLFDNACQIVLRDVFNIHAINVDGKNDGGTDFIGVGPSGERDSTAYQVTTQKENIPTKLRNDVKKSIEKLNANRFYFLTSKNISETSARKLEHELSRDLNIPVTCYGSHHIAGFLLEDSLLNKFLDQTGYPLPRSFIGSSDFKEMALYGYTIMSEDARGMRDGIYDDTIFFILSDRPELSEEQLLVEIMKFLGIGADKELYIKSRISSLFSTKRIRRTDSGLIALASNTISDVIARKRLYESELKDLASAQIDILRNDFNVDWTLEDSKQVSVFIADSYVAEQIDILGDIKSTIFLQPIFNNRNRKVDDIKKYIVDKTGLSKQKASDVASVFIKNASNHPLITKLSRASVYISLEGSNPIVTAKALGASRWSEFSILVEPSVAIPWICSQLYRGSVNSFFDNSRKSVERAKKLDCKLYIPYFYINECASHLIRARSYSTLEKLNFSQDELRYSHNAFIANYYSLKQEGERVPASLLDYLKTFSSSVHVERNDWKTWVRSVMTDIQSILNRSGIDFIDIPFYQPENCSRFQTEYTYALDQRQREKPRVLIDHDVWAMQFTHEKTNLSPRNEHWAILTFDKAMMEIGRNTDYAGWITTPDRFLDLTAGTQSLSDAQYVSLVHSLASSSEKTLSMGARIIDRLVNYASNEMQNWEFKQDFESFKKNLLSEVDLDSVNATQEIDLRVDAFLKEHGIKSIEEQEATDFD